MPYHGSMNTLSRATLVCTRAVGWVGGLALTAGIAIAQQAPSGLPATPTPAKPDTPPTLMTLLVVFLIAALTLFASLMPAKRGHQD